MKLSIIAAKSENNVIGCGRDIPWVAKGEQLIFKALTFNQWLLLGRKTYESMGQLPNRKYAVVSAANQVEAQKDVRVFPAIDEALKALSEITDQVLLVGGGQLFASLIHRVDIIHLSTVHITAQGDVTFPAVPNCFQKIFSQHFKSNIDYTYEIWEKRS
jgi:dihydrofolate reductase (trimethoprim resistance protein)